MSSHPSPSWRCSIFLDDSRPHLCSLVDPYQDPRHAMRRAAPNSSRPTMSAIGRSTHFSAIVPAISDSRPHPRSLERGVARMSPNHTPGMFDWTPILLSAPRDLANICNQSIRVGTIGEIELFERVQVSKMVPVEYQIFATAHLRYSINRKADALVNGYEQVEQDKRNDHGI